MPDYFGGAASNIDAQKAASLTDLAQNGSAAQAAYTSGQAANQAAMADAVRGAMARAVGAGAVGAGPGVGVNSNPTAIATTPGATVGTAFQDSNSRMGADAAARAAFTGNEGTIQGNFFNNMKQAIPVVERMYQGKIAGIQQKAAQAAQNRGNRNPFTSMGGAATAGTAIEDSAERRYIADQQESAAGTGALLDPKFNEKALQAYHANPELQAQYHQRVSAEAGIAPALGAAAARSASDREAIFDAKAARTTSADAKAAARANKEKVLGDYGRAVTGIQTLGRLLDTHDPSAPKTTAAAIDKLLASGLDANAVRRAFGDYGKDYIRGRIK